MRYKVAPLEVRPMDIVCPLCAHRHADDWEVLQSGDAGSITCEACGMPFQMLVWECQKCEDHVAHTWVEGAGAETSLDSARCASCGAPYEQKNTPANVVGDEV
jgi:transcription elongation factor Elf1